MQEDKNYIVVVQMKFSLPGHEFLGGVTGKAAVTWGVSSTPGEAWSGEVAKTTEEKEEEACSSNHASRIGKVGTQSLC